MQIFFRISFNNGLHCQPFEQTHGRYSRFLTMIWNSFIYWNCLVFPKKIVVFLYLKCSRVSLLHEIIQLINKCISNQEYCHNESNICHFIFLWSVIHVIHWVVWISTNLKTIQNTIDFHENSSNYVILIYSYLKHNEAGGEFISWSLIIIQLIDNILPCGNRYLLFLSFSYILWEFWISFTFRRKFKLW